MDNAGAAAAFAASAAGRRQPRARPPLDHDTPTDCHHNHPFKVHKKNTVANFEPVTSRVSLLFFHVNQPHAPTGLGSSSFSFHLVSDSLKKGPEPCTAMQALEATHPCHTKGQNVHVEREQPEIGKASNQGSKQSCRTKE